MAEFDTLKDWTVSKRDFEMVILRDIKSIDQTEANQLALVAPRLGKSGKDKDYRK